MATMDTRCLHCGFRKGAHYGAMLAGEPVSDCPIPDLPDPTGIGLTKRAAPPGSAGYFVEKVEAGQVWCNRQSGATWVFDEIRDGNAYGHPIGSADWGIHFGGLNLDQRPDDWNVEWYCQSVKVKGEAKVKSPVPVKVVPKDERQVELEFFKATQPGQCACGIPRQQCDYHR